MVVITGSYTGALRCMIQHGPSGSVIETDAPADNHGRAERFSPTDLMAAALLSCMTTTLAIKTRARGWSFEGTRMRAEKHMSDEGPRRIVSLPVEIWFDTDLEPDGRAEVETILRACPVYMSLHPDIKTPLVLHWPRS